MTHWVLVVGGVVGSVNLSHKVLWNSGTPSCLLSCVDTGRQQYLVNTRVALDQQQRGSVSREHSISIKIDQGL